MAKTAVVGEGLCPKCGKKTKIENTTFEPFPGEDEQRWITETCASCDFHVLRGFWSTDATSNRNHEEAMGWAKERVEEAVREISQLISAYPNTHIRPDITCVAAALKSLSRMDFHGQLILKDFSLLYVELAELAKSPLAEIRFDSMAEIRSAAQSDRQSGRTMDEWHENEARVEARGGRVEEKVFDAVVALVRQVEKNIKEQK